MTKKTNLKQLKSVPKSEESLMTDATKKELNPADDWEFWTKPIKSLWAKLKPAKNTWRGSLRMPKPVPPSKRSDAWRATHDLPQFKSLQPPYQYGSHGTASPARSLNAISGSVVASPFEKLSKQKTRLEAKVRELEKQIKNLQSWIPTLTVTTKDVSMQKTIVVTYTPEQLYALGRDQLLMNLVKQLDARLGPRMKNRRIK